MHLQTVEAATNGRRIDESSLWYCAQTVSGRERGLERTLSRIGIETYLPMIQVHRKRTQYVHELRANDNEGMERRDYAAKAPLFPGYLFAKLDELDWARTKMLEVAYRPKWVNFGEGPVIIPPDMLSAIAAWDEGEKKPECGYAPLIEGQTVEVTAGSWAGMNATYVRSLKGGERAVLLINAMGALRNVDLPRSYFQAC